MFEGPTMNILERNIKIKVSAKKQKYKEQMEILELEVTIIKINNSQDGLKSSLEMANECQQTCR